MLSRETRVRIADNTGALSAIIIGTAGKCNMGTRKCFKVGNIVKIAVKSSIPEAKIKKGTVSNAIIVRSKYPYRTKEGFYTRSGENAVVLLDNDFKIIGTKVFGFVNKNAIEKRAMEMKVGKDKDKSIRKILSVAEGVY